jgi:NAD(P)-dependent dehydrogenase (short-subunit alcohol dehydrogenase family)
MGATVTYDFTGKRALVTGATRGIGRTIAMDLARSGCAVVATGRDQAALRELAVEIEALDGTCETYSADVSSATDAISMAHHVLRDDRPCDILINNAGINHLERLVDLTVEHWDEVINVNLRAPALISSVVARHMMERRSGSIVHVASLSSVKGFDEHSSYCASKFGLHGLTQVMAVELGPYGIRVNAVGPTVVLTPLGLEAWGDPAKADPMKARIPLGRFVTVEEVSSAVLFLASDAASMIHGQILLVDGGFSA